MWLWNVSACNVDKLGSANVDCLPFLPRSKLWLKSQTPPSIIPKSQRQYKNQYYWLSLVGMDGKKFYSWS